MSDDVLALVITAAIFAVFFAWMPLLNFICPPCSRFLERRRAQKNSPKENLPLAALPTKR
jgi:hypothetical protein